MDRREFAKLAGLFGMSLPFQGLLSSCDKTKINFEGKVLILGAGAAGMAAGYYLSQQGIDFQILEATAAVGGRLKTDESFADFPIPLGAEWLHVSTGIFQEIVNNSGVSVNVPTVEYGNDATVGEWDGSQLSISSVGSYPDRKFVNGSWLDFLKDYILPSVEANIVFNSVVSQIDYSGDKVVVTTASGQTYSADRVIFTIPLKILQGGSITFNPALPDRKSTAINDAYVWDGIKVFLEFSNAFYPTFTEVSFSNAGEVLYYDAAYGQNTQKNILGLFSIGTDSQPYTSRSGQDLLNYILQELDTIFAGQASPAYLQHIVQNWTADPFAGGAYINDHENWRVVERLQEPVAGKIFFAGEAYTEGNDWGSAHDAIRSAKQAVEAILTG